jgi:hypothetical protein
VDAESKVLWALAARVLDLVLDNANGPSSLVASMSTTVELLESQVIPAATNGVCRGTHSVLAAALSHFLELKSELELLGSERNMSLTVDQVDVI